MFSRIEFMYETFLIWVIIMRSYANRTGLEWQRYVEMKMNMDNRECYFIWPHRYGYETSVRLVSIVTIWDADAGAGTDAIA